MSPRATACLSIFLCVALVTDLRGQVMDESAAKSRVLALENIWNQAEVIRDWKALDVLFDNELLYVNSSGVLMTKGGFLAYVRSAHMQALSTDVSNIQIFDDTAIVNGTYRSKELRNGKMITLQGRFTDTWIHKNSAWVCVAAQSTPIVTEGGH